MRWWRSVISMEFRKILAYRSDFWVTFLGQVLIQLIIARALWQSIFEAEGKTEMQGFTLEMMTLYYLIVPICSRMLTGENIGFISREIYDGTFNRYLIYPLSLFQYKSLTYLTYTAFYGIQLILLYSIYQLFFVDGSVSLMQFQNLLLGVGLIFVAATVYVMMAMVIELLALWADNIWSLMVMLRFFCNFLGGGSIPLNFFPEWVMKGLIYTPFPHMVSMPVRTIMGLASTSEILNGLGILFVWGIIFSVIVRTEWVVGQKNYSGVGI